MSRFSETKVGIWQLMGPSALPDALLTDRFRALDNAFPFIGVTGP